MKFKNYEVEDLANLLFNLSLKGKDSRMRTRFVTLLEHQLNNIIIKEEKELIDQYAKKDEEGNIVTDQENSNVFELKKETAQEYHEERHSLLNEYFYIEENESNKMVILTVAEIILEGDFEVSGKMAKQYDEWCEQFEAVAVDYGVDRR